MNKNRYILGMLVMVCLMGVTFDARGRIFNIPQDYPRISDAMVRSIEGDEIIVAPGIYHESVSFLPRNVILRSTFNGDWSIVRNTIIDVGGQTSCIFATDYQTSQSLLRGFTIRNGIGGVIGHGTHATIEYCIFQNNSNFDTAYSIYQGGAINGCDGLIQNCIFEGNRANLGGALANCNGIIQNSLFYHNSSHWGALGYYKTRPAAGADTNQLIYGHGAALYNCNGLIRGNTLVDNYRLDYPFSPNTPGGLSGCRGSVVNNIVWHTTMTAALEYENSATPRYSLFRAAHPGQGNLAGDPKFVDPAKNDYRLQPTSPAIDAGQTTTGLINDFYGTPRGKLWRTQGSHGDGSHTDIGAHEFDPGPLTLWFSPGGETGVAGKQMLLRYALASTTSPGAFPLTLQRGGKALAGLGQLTATTGHAGYDTAGAWMITLPAWLAAGNGYQIMTSGNTGTGGTGGPRVAFQSWTPPFTVKSPSVVAEQIWQGYQ